MRLLLSIDIGWTFMSSGWLPVIKTVDTNFHPTEAM